MYCLYLPLETNIEAMGKYICCRIFLELIWKTNLEDNFVNIKNQVIVPIQIRNGKIDLTR